MDWVEDVGKARAGDMGARERLGEYLTPFMHAVLLAQVPHHVAHRLVPKVLEEFFASLNDVDDGNAGARAMALARRHADSAARAGQDEAPSGNAQVHEGRQLLRRARTLPVPARERLLLRLVAGVPGPEQAEFSRVSEDTVRSELEQGATELARALGLSGAFAGDPYLWESMGAPSTALARLEMQLTALRFSPDASDNSVVAEGQQPFPSLTDKKPAWDPEDVTESHERRKIDRPPVMTEPAAAAPNPFKGAVETIAASDLPAAASEAAPSDIGTTAPVPPIPSGSQSRNFAPIPSASQGRGPMAPIPSSSQSGRGPIAPIPSGSQSRNFAALPASQSRGPVPPVGAGSQSRNFVPLPSAAQGSGPAQAAVASAIANQPTTVSAALDSSSRPTNEAADDTSANALPLGARVGLANQHTQIRLDAVVPRARPVVFSTQGAAPFMMAGALAVVALLGAWVAISTAERRVKSGWQMTEVLVAAEDLNEGAIITQENIATRSVPDSFITPMVVRPSQLGQVLEQRLAVPVQTGDPLIYNQLAGVRVAERLSTRIVPRARAVSIMVDTVTAVGRWVRPGDHVDVLSAFEDPKRGRTAVTFLQNVPVVAAGPITSFMPEKSINERKRAYQNVSFLLTPEEVEAVVLATQLGKVTLTLRTEEDNEVKDREFHTELKTLLTGERQKLLEAQRFHTIQMIRNAPREPVLKDAPKHP